MNQNALKRQRSEESLFSVQSKVYLNEKLANSHDSKKMEQIYEKTKKLLFKAAQSKSAPDHNNNDKYNHNGTSNEALPTWKLVSLRGNGDVESLPLPEGYDEDDPNNEFLWVKSRAPCCDRQTYVQSHCGNQCPKDLCEYCGYSCIECGIFLCNYCVDLFGSGNPDRPVCERCSLFV